MQCPNCGSPLLKVSVSFRGDVACQFAGSQDFRILDKIALDSEFEREADCGCLACGWSGQVADAQVTVGRSLRSRARVRAKSPLSPNEFEQIQKKIELLEPQARQIAQRLVEEVARLNSLLDTVVRLSATADSAAADTTVG